MNIGLVAAVKAIWKAGGIAAMYQGVVPYLIADGSSGAIKFATFELSKVYIEERTPKQWHRWTNFACAAGAMLACSFVLVPGEVLKTRLQAGGKNSLLGVIGSIFQQEGLFGFFAGYGATLLRDVPYTVLELGIYENLKTLLRGRATKGTQSDELLAAALTGAVTSFVTTPLDLVKTKLMMRQYSGVADAFSSIYRTQGMSGLFAGSIARVSWLLPFTTIYLGVYEMSKRRLLALKTLDAKVKFKGAR